MRSFAVKTESIFAEMRLKGYDDDFEATAESDATSHPAGCLGKVQVMRSRVENGQPIFHKDDNPDQATIAEQKLLKEFSEQLRVEKKKQNKLKRDKNNFLRNK
jgi:hypothetical protein